MKKVLIKIIKFVLVCCLSFFIFSIGMAIGMDMPMVSKAQELSKEYDKQASILDTQEAKIKEFDSQINSLKTNIDTLKQELD